MKSIAATCLLILSASFCSGDGAVRSFVDVTVVGEVEAPGRYKLPTEKSTVGELVRLAGGFTRFAQLYTDIGGLTVYQSPKTGINELFGPKKYSLRIYSLERNKSKIPALLESLPLEEGDILSISTMVF